MPKICNQWVALLCCLLSSLILGVFIAFQIWIIIAKSHHHPAPTIELASTDFTVVNMTQTHLSANWDLSISIPEDLPGFYICLQGDLQASILYKNVTLATSPPQKYMDLHFFNPQLLEVSTVVSNEDVSGFIGKDIMEDIKERKEVEFELRFFLTDCRKKSTGVMNYKCDQVTVRFGPSSETKATLFGNYPKCKNF